MHETIIEKPADCGIIVIRSHTVIYGTLDRKKAWGTRYSWKWVCHLHWPKGKDKIKNMWHQWDIWMVNKCIILCRERRQGDGVIEILSINTTAKPCLFTYEKCDVAYVASMIWATVLITPAKDRWKNITDLPSIGVRNINSEVLCAQRLLEWVL